MEVAQHEALEMHEALEAVEGSGRGLRLWKQ
jgi:hypothetical protein